MIIRKGGAALEGALSYLRELNIWSMLLRLVLAVTMGGLIGFERETKRRAAGFRTYMLVALGATITMLLSQYLSIMVDGPWSGLVKNVVHTDVSRLGAQVVNGVGFLGAGTIIVTHRQEIQGLTTAAGLWASACMGLAIGAGFYECMLAAVILILLCMALFTKVEDAAVSRSRSMNIYVEMESIDTIGAVTAFLKNDGCRIYDVELCSPADRANGPLGAVFTVGLEKKQDHLDVLAKLSSAQGLVRIEES
jgi:putative Mg2+ transporter-C (MgtC) family protein